MGIECFCLFVATVWCESIDFNDSRVLFRALLAIQE